MGSIFFEDPYELYSFGFLLSRLCKHETMEN